MARLHPWARVANAYKWDTLLVGNGLSINVWSRFDYGELFDYAGGGGLTRSDLKLFPWDTELRARPR